MTQRDPLPNHEGPKAGLNPAPSISFSTATLPPLIVLTIPFEDGGNTMEPIMESLS